MNPGIKSNYSIFNGITEVIKTLNQFVSFRSQDDLLITALYVLLTHCANPTLRPPKRESGR